MLVFCAMGLTTNDTGDIGCEVSNYSITCYLFTFNPSDHVVDGGGDYICNLGSTISRRMSVSAMQLSKMFHVMCEYNPLSDRKRHFVENAQVSLQHAFTHRMNEIIRRAFHAHFHQIGLNTLLTITANFRI